MKRFGRAMLELTLEVFYGIIYAIQINLRYLGELLQIALPYGMYLMGQYCAMDRGHFAVGGELFIPVLVLMLTYYVNGIARKYNKGTSLPIPEKRFTEVDDEGEVSIRQDRVQELLLYMADLEDWMERKGMF